jgi:2-succinyl-6-hydroxy-2,4-cyclohexadiene-1-carboxylate synthase
MIHVFHGFLGSPEDFAFLKNPEVMIHDLYAMNTYPTVNSGDTLIGYSMGGRIALEIAHLVNYKIKRLVLINAHPGLATEEEKINRAQWEMSILQDLKTKTKEAFIEDWNNLPIFFHDSPIKKISTDKFSQSHQIFERYRLSKQQNHLPEIITHKEKILYIVGLFDEKYMDLASEEFLPHDIAVKGIPGGHRLHQQEKELLKVLQDEGIL